MCGLVGTAGDLMMKDEMLIKRMLILDYFRGVDSIGLAAVRTNGEVKIAKAAANPFMFFDWLKFKEVNNGNQSRAFIGHNRASTSGATNDWNAHPFQHDHITGAMNGTLLKRDKKMLEDLLEQSFDVDSDALFAAIAKKGINQIIPMLTEGKEYQEGAWALTWHDRNEGTINFIRNRHRPLWFAYTKDMKRLFWASEWPIIDAAIKCAGASYEQYVEEVTGHKFWSIEEDVHFSFKLDDIVKGSDKKLKPKVKKLKGKLFEEPKYSYSGGTAGDGNDPFGRARNGSQHGTVCGFQPTTPSTTNHGTTSLSKEKKKPTIIRLLGDDYLPLAGYFHEADYAQLQGNQGQACCVWCSDPVPFGEPGSRIYEQDNSVICRLCNGHPEIDENNPPPIRIYAVGTAFEAMAGAL